MPTITPTRRTASVITEKPVRTDSIPAFDWERDYGPLYRACPDAFWLAPDADDLLPRLERAAPEPVVEPVAEAIEPPSVHNEKNAVGVASLCAGPIFVATLLFLDGCARWKILEGVAAAVASVAAAPFSVIGGTVLALVPVTFGTLILGRLGRIHAFWRRPALWTAVGTVIGIGIAAKYADGSTIGAAALIFTSAASARIARLMVRWEGVEAA